jgi:hypothetical protein
MNKGGVEKGVAVTVIPDEFKKVIFDFVADISNTFPEYQDTLRLFLGESSAESADSSKVVTILYEYCSKVYPERFFDILYKNDKIFDKGDAGDAGDAANVNVNTHFLPNIDFCVLWNTEGISDATRETIWKYLQLILMTIITNIEDKKSFGDAANLFEAINENELRGKLEETIQQMYNMFETNAGNADNAETTDSTSGADASGKKKTPSFNFFDWAKDIGAEGEEGAKDSSSSSSSSFANAESIHEHISNILNGKIGKLAKEIAEETAKDVDFDMDFDESKGDSVNFQNVFQKMFKNPGKLMGLVKSVGSKLDQKFKSGEIKESELMQEASDLLSKMKSMPGMSNLTDMLNKMGMGGMGNMGGMGGGGGKMNFGAMQSQLQRNMKVTKMKERMQQKLAQQQQQKLAQQQQQQQQEQKSQPTVFSTGETVERTPVDTIPSSLMQNQNKKKNKKNKSKK